MIVEMKKYTFLIYHREYDDFLYRLRDLGVVHIVEKNEGVPVENDELRRMQVEEERIRKTIAALSSRLVKKEAVPASGDVDGMALVDRYDALIDRKNKIGQRLATLQKEIERSDVWGNFDRENLIRLERAGYRIRFFTVSERQFEKEWEDRYHAFRIAEVGHRIYFVTVTPNDQSVELENTEPVKLPDLSLTQLEQERMECSEAEKDTETEIDQFARRHLNDLRQAWVRIKENFEYSKVILDTEKQADDKLMLLQGWVPVTKEGMVNDFLRQEQVYFQVEKPTGEDQVPVLLKNNAFTRLFEAIGDLYDVPNYYELDLTPFFAPFFVMFFGLCLGDAGYGVLITIAALVARNRVKPNLKPIMTLAFWLGLGTVLFGTVSGTLFGIPLLNVQWPWIQDLKRFMLSSDQMFTFALIVGACQIVFGMVIKAIGYTRRYGFWKALSSWGWLLLIVGCGSAFGLEKLGELSSETSGTICLIVVAIAAIGIFLLNDIHRNPLINIGAGIWDAYNMATGLLGDLLSYIRLFALGISGSVMGLVFNDLALKMTENLPVVVSQVVMLLILLFGHSMNIFMNGLGAFVHPMRLTFVEFYKNAGFEGGGKKYRPFVRYKNE